MEAEGLSYKTESDDKKPYELTILVPKKVDLFYMGNDFIPRGAKEFLNDWQDYISYDPSMDDYKVDGFIITHEDQDNDIVETCEYQENGILKEITTEYKGDVIFKLILNNPISFGEYWLAITVVSIIGVIFLTTKRISWRR